MIPKFSTNQLEILTQAGFVYDDYITQWTTHLHNKGADSNIKLYHVIHFIHLFGEFDICISIINKGTIELVRKFNDYETFFNHINKYNYE